MHTGVHDLSKGRADLGAATDGINLGNLVHISLKEARRPGSARLMRHARIILPQGLGVCYSNRRQTWIEAI